MKPPPTRGVRFLFALTFLAFPEAIFAAPGAIDGIGALGDVVSLAKGWRTTDAELSVADARGASAWSDVDIFDGARVSGRTTRWYALDVRLPPRSSRPEDTRISLLL